jgi:hypothetical protein
VKRERKKRPGGGDIALLTKFDPAACMAYLHGDVVQGEQEAACHYEYARESGALREAASLHREDLNFEEIAEEIASNETFSSQTAVDLMAVDLILASPWLEIFTCPHFPEIPWNSLPAEAREELLRAYPDPVGSFMTDVRRLDGILDRLKGACRKSARATRVSAPQGAAHLARGALDAPALHD